MTTTGVGRLATEARNRRRQLGLAQADLASRGGPSVVTVGKIERAEIPHPQAATLRGLDMALRWHPGGAAGALKGQAPRELAGDQTDPGAAVIEAIRNDPNLLPEAREHLERQYGLLLRVQAVAREEADDAPITDIHDLVLDAALAQEDEAEKPPNRVP